MWRVCHVTLMMWRTPRRGLTSRLTFDTRLASGLSRARQKVRIRNVPRIGLRQALRVARYRNNQLFLGLGRRRVRAKTARQTFNCLDFGDNGRNSLAGGACSQCRRE
jgi:hypothetical protein